MLRSISGTRLHCEAPRVKFQTMQDFLAIQKNWYFELNEDTNFQIFAGYKPYYLNKLLIGRRCFGDSTWPT